MAKKTPLQRVKDEHGGKDKLVDKLVDLVERGDEDKGEFRSRLQAAPNTKLLRLFMVSSAVKQRFGGKEGLINGVLELTKRSKDEGYRAKLAGWSVVRLFALHRQAEARVRKAERAAQRAS